MLLGSSVQSNPFRSTHAIQPVVPAPIVTPASPIDLAKALEEVPPSPDPSKEVDALQKRVKTVALIATRPLSFRLTILPDAVTDDMRREFQGIATSDITPEDISSCLIDLGLMNQDLATALLLPPSETLNASPVPDEPQPGSAEAIVP